MKIDDASAILDTTDALVFVAGVLIAVTAMLDTAAMAAWWCAETGKRAPNA